MRDRNEKLDFIAIKRPATERPLGGKACGNFLETHLLRQFQIDIACRRQVFQLQTAHLCDQNLHIFLQILSLDNVENQESHEKRISKRQYAKGRKHRPQDYSAQIQIVCGNVDAL